MTGISWTDDYLSQRLLAQGHVLQNLRLDHPDEALAIHTATRSPLVQISVALAAVAGLARGNDVPRNRLSPAGDWHDVVPGLSRTVTVRARVLERLQKVGGALRGDAIDPPRAQDVLALPSIPKVRAPAVMESHGFVDVSAASASADLFSGKPRLAVATPSITEVAPLPSLSLAWPAAGWRLAARAARSVPTVRPGSITTEVPEMLPRLTAAAPLLAQEDTRGVLGWRHPESSGTGAQGAEDGLGHATGAYHGAP